MSAQASTRDEGKVPLRHCVAACLPSVPGYQSGVYVRKLVELLGDAGTRVLELIRDPPPTLRGFDSLELSYSDFLRLVEVALKEPHTAGLGLRHGASFGIADYGILGYALLGCRDLGQCVKTFGNLDALFGKAAEFDRHFEIRERQAAFRCRWHVFPAEIRRFEEESALAQFTLLRSLCEKPGSFVFQGVDFTGDAPPDPKVYEVFFGCPVRFGQAETELRFDRTLLEQPFALANEEARRACEQQCEAFLRRLDPAQALTEQVRRLILQSPGTIPGFDHLARELHVSSRTLRRRLREEGTAYSGIVTEVRIHLSCRYLSDTGLAIKEIGYLLGYSEVANFQRAFRMWVGETPAGYRRRKILERRQALRRA